MKKHFSCLAAILLVAFCYPFAKVPTLTSSEKMLLAARFSFKKFPFLKFPTIRPIIRCERCIQVWNAFRHGFHPSVPLRHLLISMATASLTT